MTSPLTRFLAASPVSRPRILAFMACITLCFFSFNHVDMAHTIGCSFAFLDGHFADFYDFNAKFFGIVNYLPSTYVIFALWGLPLKLLGLATPLAYPPVAILLWFKVLTTLFYGGSGYLIHRITQKFTEPATTPHLSSAAWIWMTSPIAVFSQFIFGQYDIITVFFTLLGLLFWLDRKLLKFSLVFGLAVTFKYFPFFMFLPLLLLVEKRPWQVIKNGLLFALPVGIEALAFLHSPEFHRGVFGFHVAGRVDQALVTIGTAQFNLIYFILFGTALAAYLTPTPDQDLKGFKTSLTFAAFSCFTIFCCFLWHPQWIIFLTPFLALFIVTGKDPEKLLWTDLLLSLAFIAVTVKNFPHNVDQMLWQKGVWGWLNPHPWENSDPMNRLAFFKILNTPAWLALFNACLIAILIGSHFFQKKPDGEAPDLLRANSYRLYIGLGFFILPALWCFISSVRV